MSLRTRLLLGYGYLVFLLLLTAGSATVGFFQLSRGVHLILEENFEGVTASIAMLDALERQDSAVLTQLLDPKADGEAFNEAAQSFEVGLAEAKNSALTDGELELLVQLERQHQQYEKLIEEVIADPPERPVLAYNARIFPAFSQAKTTVLALVDRHRAGMVAADKEANEVAVQNGVWLGFLVTVALLSLVFLSRALQREVLSRLVELKRTAESIAAGDTKRRLPTGQRDELGAIAEQFNRAVDLQNELRAQMQGRLDEQKQLLLGLLQKLDRPAALVGFDGHVVASTMPDRDLECLLNQRAWLQRDAREQVRNLETLERCPVMQRSVSGGRTASFRLLIARGACPVGWLAEVHSTTSTTPPQVAE